MTISKTDFIAYLGAPRHLWAMKHNKLTPQETSLFVQHLFNQGYEVEALAEKYIHQYLIPQYGVTMDDVIFQPTCVDMSFEARTDVLILNPKTNKWDMYEIKSSVNIDKIHEYDITFQYLVFKSKYDIGDRLIIHLNKSYVRNGEIDLEKLFNVKNMNKVVDKLKDEVRELRNNALFVAQTDNVADILACIKPKDCPCLSVCHPNLPEYSIYDINNISKSEKKVRELEQMGIMSIYDVPSDFKLTNSQRFQVDVAHSGKIYRNEDKIRDTLGKLKFPLYFLDYETFNPAVPIYDRYKPYQHITFQYSLHVKGSPTSEYKHYEFIETNKVDPIPNLIASLKENIGDSGSIIVWYKTFETCRTKEMAELYPEFSEYCAGIVKRIFDLMDVFKDQYYLDSATKGSNSIKQVLPTMVPDLSYKSLEIREGATAMMTWFNMVYDNKLTNEPFDKLRVNERTLRQAQGESLLEPVKLLEHQKKQFKERTKINLLKYCELDTLAMVKIYEKLILLINS